MMTIRMLLICENKFDNWILSAHTVHPKETREILREQVRQDVEMGKYQKPLYAVVVIPKR